MQDRRVTRAGSRRYVLMLLVAVVAAVACQDAVTLTRNMKEPEPTQRGPAISDELRNASIVIRKKQRTVELYDGEKLIKTYQMVLGFAPEGDKEREGDGKTPEGSFYVFAKNPKSKFHLSIGLSYPSTEDAERGLVSGLIGRAERDSIVRAVRERRMPPQKTGLGGEIYIHGGGVESDWTWGCIALKNEDIEEIYEIVGVGSAVTILP